MKLRCFSFVGNTEYCWKNGLINIVSLRAYLQKTMPEVRLSYSLVEIEWNLRYRMTEKDIKDCIENGPSYYYLGEYVYGKTMKELIDLESILKLYENFKNSNNLLNDIKVKQPKAIDNIKKLCNRKVDYDYACFTLYDNFAFYILLAAFYLKINNPNIKIIFGGVHINISENVAKFYSMMNGIDYVIMGDIENGVEMVLSGKLQEGLSKVSPFDMSTLPSPVYNKIDSIITKGNVSLTSARGCPNQCGFCVSNNERLRGSDLDVFLKAVKDNQLEHNKFLTMPDPIPNFTKNRFRRLVKGLIDIDNKLAVNCELVLQNLEEDIIEQMPKAGIHAIFTGADVWSPTLRKKIGKPEIDIKRTIEIIDAIVAQKIDLYVSWISAMPMETRDEFEEDVEYKMMLADRYSPSDVWMCNTTCLIIAGSPFYKNPEKYGIKIEFWTNPNKNLPEFDEIISKMGRFVEYEEPTYEEIMYRYKRIQEFCTFVPEKSEFVIRGRNAN